MALPADSINRTKEQAAVALLNHCYQNARLMRPDIVQGYYAAQYGHAIAPENLTAAQRKLITVGAILGVAWNTDAATTEGDIVTAVQALVA